MRIEPGDGVLRPERFDGEVEGRFPVVAAQVQAVAGPYQDLGALGVAVPERIVQGGVAVRPALDVELDAWRLGQQPGDLDVPVVDRLVQRHRLEDRLDGVDVGAGVQQLGDDLGVAVAGGDQEGRVGIVEAVDHRDAGVDGLAGGEQRFDGVQVASDDSRHQEVTVERLAVGGAATLDQLPDRQHALLRRLVDGELVVVVLLEGESVEGSHAQPDAVVQQILDDVRPGEPHRLEQRRVAGRRRDGVDEGAPLDQQLHDREAASLARLVEGSAAGTVVGGEQIGASVEQHAGDLQVAGPGGDHHHREAGHGATSAGVSTGVEQAADFSRVTAPHGLDEVSLGGSPRGIHALHVIPPHAGTIFP